MKSPVEIAFKGRSGVSRIVIGQTIEMLPSLCSGKEVLIVADEALPASFLKRLPDWPIHTVKGGENAKTLETVKDLWQVFLDNRITRESTVIALGGGSITDLVGFAASTYMRGIAFGFIPTTLTSQTDAAIGGKNAINCQKVKNLIGTFSQPRFVLIDPKCVQSLSDIQFRQGLAESVKCAAIADGEYFAWLEAKSSALLTRDTDAVLELIEHSVRIKLGFITRDEMDRGARRALNFGHSLGHVLELHSELPHGYAVAIGMGVAARLSERITGFPTLDTDRLVRLLKAFELPVKQEMDVDTMILGLMTDKKRSASSMDFVLLKRLGESVVHRLSYATLEGYLRDLR